MLRWSKNRKAEDEEKPSSASTLRAAAAPAAERSGLSDSALRAQSAPVETPKSLPELLLAEGKVSEEQLQRALAKQQETGEFIGEVLVNEGVLDEKSLISFLAKHCKIPHLSLLDYLIDESLLSLVPKDFCLQYRLLPIDKLGRNLTLAMVNPLNTEALKKVQDLCPDLRIKPILCAHKHFEAVTQRLFSEKGKGPAMMSASQFGLAKIPKVDKKAAAEAPPQAAEPPPAIEAPPTEEFPSALEFPEPEPQPAPVPDAPPPPPTEDSGDGIDGDAVVEEVFSPSEEAEEIPAPVGVGGGLDSSSVMREMASVMMNSMRDTYAMLARRMDLFRGVNPEDVAKIFARGITVEFEEDKVIFEKGQPGNELYLILGGEVQIFDGEKEIAVLNRGDMFGEMALVSEEPRSASARTTCPTSLLSLTTEIVHNVMPREVAIQLLVNIIITLSERLRIANEK